MDEDLDAVRPRYRVPDSAFLGTAAIGLALLFLAKLETVVPLFLALPVALAGVGLALGALNAGYRPSLALLGLVANATVLGLVVAIMGGIG